MAKAITRTRAEVAEIRSDAALRPQSASSREPSPPPQARDVFAAAERIRDVTWAMRGHGFDPTTCDQLEELAGSILTATSLRDPTDHRASKLSEVLQYLEHRIDTLLESSADGDTVSPEPALEPADQHAFGPGTEAQPATALAGPVATDGVRGAADFKAGLACPPSPTDFHIDLSAAHDDLEGDAPAESRPRVEPAPLEAPPAADLSVDPASELQDPASERGEHHPILAIDLPTAGAEPSPLRSEAGENPPELVIFAQSHDVAAQTAEITRSAPNAVDNLDPSSESRFVEQVAAEPLASPAPEAEFGQAAGFAVALSHIAAPDDLAAPAEPPAPAPAAAPDEAPSLPPPVEGGAPAVGAPANGAFLSTVEMTEAIPVPPSAPEVQPVAAAPLARPAATAEPPAFRGDLLAALKALSDDERIALFS
ncbi:MAG TPA: hypothetical protein VGN55_15435 [Xanthobacteraceae bacterium]